MTKIINKKIKIGISACNFGAKVRYNRKGWDRVSQLSREKNAFIWMTICPEVISGLGIPRYPIKLIGGNGNDFWNKKAKIKNKKGEILTNQIKKGVEIASNIIDNNKLEAFIYMDGSPTCGINRTTLKNKNLGKPPGVFGSLLLKKDLFLISAFSLDSPITWWDARRRLHSYIWLKGKNIKTQNDLKKIWHTLSPLLNELNPESAQNIHTTIIKNITPSENNLEKTKEKISNMLKQPSNRPAIQKALEKQIKHYKEKFNKPYPKKILDINKGSNKFVKLLLDIENRSINENFPCQITPIIYRDKR